MSRHERCWQRHDADRWRGAVDATICTLCVRAPTSSTTLHLSLHRYVRSTLALAHTHIHTYTHTRCIHTDVVVFFAIVHRAESSSSSSSVTWCGPHGRTLHLQHLLDESTLSTMVSLAASSMSTTSAVVAHAQAQQQQQSTEQHGVLVLLKQLRACVHHEKRSSLRQILPVYEQLLAHVRVTTSRCCACTCALTHTCTRTQLHCMCTAAADR